MSKVTKSKQASRRILKIAYVIDDGMNSEDGVQAYVKTLGAWMSSRGHSVHYLCGETSRTDIPGLYPLAKNLKVTFNGNRLSMPWPTSTAKIKQHVQMNDYDVVHVQIPHSPFFGAKVARLSSEKSVVMSTFHILPYGVVARYGSKLLGIWLCRNLRYFDKHIANSPATMMFSRWAFGLKDSVLVPNMVNLALFSPKQDRHISPANKTFEIVFVGRLVERKGCRYLLQAARRLHGQQPDLDFKIHICGKGPLEGELQRLANENGLKDVVEFHGFISNEEKVRRLQAADIAVFPSYSGESFGIVLIEAMAAGAGVVIGGNNPGYSYVLQETPETLVDVQDEERFAELLGRVMTDVDFYKKIHEKQQQSVRQFDVEVVGNQILELYESCMHRRNRK